MKQIEVSDEMYDFLMNISKELNTQDNRATAKPYFFQVQVKEQIAVPAGCGNEAWHYDGSLIETEEEINNTIAEYKDISISEVQKMADYEKEQILENAGYNKINYDYKHNYENCFLTEKACEKHIEINRHNYKEPYSYLQHAYRNEEMEKLFEFLSGLQKKCTQQIPVGSIAIKVSFIEKIIEHPEYKSMFDTSEGITIDFHKKGNPNKRAKFRFNDYGLSVAIDHVTENFKSIDEAIIFAVSR